MLTGVLFLDLKKVFDTVDHTILLNKLSMYGSDDQSVDWFSNYLSGRTQCTKVTNVLSSCLLHVGCPRVPSWGPSCLFST